MSTFESNPPPLMQCGCLAMAVDKDGNPCCVVHAPDPRAYKIAEKPDLAGRKARCHYYGKKTRKSECNYKGDVKEDGVWICRCEQPSDKPLPFFKYLGPGSPASEEYCKHCSYTYKAHWPIFQIEIRITRRWHKIPESISMKQLKQHLPDKDAAELFAKVQIEKFLKHTDEETIIYKAELIGITGPHPSGRDHEFEEHGPWEYDEFYCGCHSWS